MKRIALLTVFFYACTFAAPQRSYAVVPIAVIGAAAVGAAMMSSSVGAYYAQNGELPQYVKAAAGAVASANDYLYQKGYLAIGPLTLTTAATFPAAASVYLGKQNAIGAKLGDIMDYVQSSASDAYQNLKDLFSSHQNTSPVAPSLFTSNAIFTVNGSNRQITTTAGVSGSTFSNNTSMFPYTGSSWLPGQWGVASYRASDGYTFVYTPAASPPGLYTFKAWKTNPTNLPPTITPSTTVDFPGLANEFSPAVPDAVADDVRDVLKKLPAGQVVKAADVPAVATASTGANTLTQAEINDYLKENTAQVAQAAADAAAQIAAANPTDAAAQIAANQAAVQAAQAAQEAAEQPDEETYSPISDSPFGTAYNPGPYDIPTRFTTFLANVKTSGLFSFSSNFFNSLPGGGSPVYQIDGGSTFGNHTIDLSDTMSTGLAILKSILLACFGFLSIRAIIMKR